jgi:HD-GYP domain-containing protein (c-di-GMP phosphodiesterase class II)
MALSVPWLLVVMAIPIAIVHLSLKRTLQLLEQTVSAVEALADLVDRRDRYTFEHSKRVASYAVQIARRLGMSAGQVETIRLAARVHDLGKIGVPDAVLLKEGRLTESEWEHMRRHPEYGYEILSRFPEYREGKELVLAHHERLDGRGYPRGIGGDRLPIEAQVIAAADTLDAMTSDRPYRRALVAGAAIEEFRRGSGQQWHPRVAAAVMDVLAGQNTSGRVAAPGHPQPAPLARPA